MMHADPQVLRDAARMLSTAARQLTRIATHIEQRGFVDAAHLSTVRANIDAAVARLPEHHRPPTDR